MARAFFYAGSRSLLVSHWAVDSQATVKLITGAFAALAGEPDAPHAEVMRQSMLALVKAGGHEAHPEFWAPFVVVGADGKAVKRLASADPAASFPAPAPISVELSPAAPGTSTAVAESAPVEQTKAEAVEPVPVLVTIPLPVHAPSVKERRAAMQEEVKRKSRYRQVPMSAWEELFSR
jgi:hypothetical protein